MARLHGKTRRFDDLKNIKVSGDELERDAFDNSRQAKAKLQRASNSFDKFMFNFTKALINVATVYRGPGNTSVNPHFEPVDSPPIDLGGTLKIEINQKGRASVQQVESNDPRMKIEVKQNTGTRMVGD